MIIRNLAWLRTEVCKLLNVDVTAPDQAVSSSADDVWADIDGCISEAYEIELEEAKNEGDPDQWVVSETLTWTYDQRTMVVPDHILNSTILRFDDETHTVPGEIIHVISRGSNAEPEVSWRDRTTLQWGLTGPGETKTIRVFYLPSASEMHAPADEPVFIPPQYRRIIVWTAAILMRERLGEATVPAWAAERDDWRTRFYLAISKGRPRDPNRPGAQASGLDLDSF